MALFFKDIEITKLRDLAPQTGLDIADLWFGSTNVYTAWRTYEGTLPATINANGDDMRQYQIFGAAGGVGDRTGNLYNKNAKDTSKGYQENRFLYANGNVSTNYSWSVSEHIDISDASSLTVKDANVGSPDPAICFYDSSYQYISGVAYNREATSVVQVPQNAVYCRISVLKINIDAAMLTEGSTPPASFVPFGYEVDMGVKSAQLFDKNATDTDNGYVAGAGLKSDGTLLSNNSVNVSEYIPVSGNTVYILRYGLESGYYDAFSACFYDISKIFISGISYSKQNPKLFTTPAAAAYVRFSFSRNDVNVVVLAKGSTIPEPLPPYSNTTTPIYIGNEPLEKDEYVDYTAQKVYRRTVNLFDKNATDTDNGYEPGYYLCPPNISGGKWANSSYAISEYIEIEGLPTITFSGYTSYYSSGIENEFYNASKQRLSQFEMTTIPATINVPTSAKYARFSIRLDRATKIMLTKGSTTPETYIPYLQPEDPPVPLPALPTCEGETIIDYAGQSVAPEKVLLKFRKEGI